MTKIGFLIIGLMIMIHVSNSQDSVMYFVPNIYNGVDTLKTVGDRNAKIKTIRIEVDPNQSSLLWIRIVDKNKRLIGEGRYKLAQTDTVYRIVEELHGERYKRPKRVNLIFKREGYWIQMKRGKMISNYYSEGKRLNKRKFLVKPII